MKLLGVALMLAACSFAQPISSGGGGAAMLACIGTPGNTIGALRQQCLDSTNAVWVCKNSSGCAVAADWAAVGGGGSTTSRVLVGCTVQGGLAGCGWNLPAAPAVAPISTAGTVLSLAFTAGTGGTNGTSALTFVGTWVTAPTGTCTVAGGLITGVSLTYSGSGVTGIVSTACSGIGAGTGTVTATISSLSVPAMEYCTSAITGGCASQNAIAWKEDILPASYTANGAIAYVIESTSSDITNKGSAQIGIFCSASLLDDPTASLVYNTAFDLGLPGTANYQTLTSGSITPGAGGVSACAAGNHIWYAIKANTTTHSMTYPLRITNVSFTR